MVWHLSGPECFALTEFCSLFSVLHHNLLPVCVCVCVCMRSALMFNLILKGTSNIEILERFQAKVLRIITDAPYYFPNGMLHRDLRVTTVKHTVKAYSIAYSCRIAKHPNRLAPPLIQEPSYPRRLKRKHPQDLQTTF
jgi:hypothetical protein